MPSHYVHHITSTDENAKPTASSRAVLRSYYCICGEFALVMQGKLDRLPRRQTDGAYIIRSQKSSDGSIDGRQFKLNVQAGDRVLIKRKALEGDKPRMEVIHQLTCSRCNSTLAYQTNHPPPGASPFVYVLPGALTEVQGRIPFDAMDGELLLEPPTPSEAVEGLEGSNSRPDTKTTIPAPSEETL